MSTISEQIKELRELAAQAKLATFGECTRKIYESALNDAADTIEILSAKLQAANMERSTSYYNGGWILCSDRLPEENHFYNVTIFDGEDYMVEPAYYAKIGYFGQKNIRPNWWTDCTSNAELIEDEEQTVVAWQPLPEPYKPE